MRLMFGKKKETIEDLAKEKQEESFLKKNANSIKDLIAPAGIDASHANHIEITASKTRYARSMIVATLPRMCTFPEFLRAMYTFGDLNVSVFINPVSESTSQNELNRTINELESERIVALDRGDINRERILEQKRLEAEELRDQIAAGFNKLFDSSIVCTLFAYSLEELDRYTEFLASEMSKTLIGVKPAWAIQDEAFKSNMPLCDNKICRPVAQKDRYKALSIPRINSTHYLSYHLNSLPRRCSLRMPYISNTKSDRVARYANNNSFPESQRYRWTLLPQSLARLPDRKTIKAKTEIIILA